MAGVIPVSGLETDFNFPWHPSLQPLDNDYLAIERAVYECAMAGCETIWVVCSDDVVALIKDRVGDYVESPYSLEKARFTKFPSDHRESVPIFYTPVHPKDRDRRDSYIWGAFHGALTSFVVSSRISSWLMPNKYYVAFPYGVYDPQEVKKYRKVISSERTFLMSYNGKTIVDGEYLSFTMSPTEYKNYVWNIKDKCSGGARTLSRSNRWSARNISIEEAMSPCDVERSYIGEVERYFRIDDWRSYREFISSDFKLKKPSKKFMKPYEFNGLFYEN